MSSDSLAQDTETHADSANSVPTKVKRTRRSQLTITGGIVPPESIRPHENHPLRYLGVNERLDAAHKALGNLILKAVEGGASTDTA